MRLLIVIEPLRVSSVIKSALHQAKALQKRGHEVTILCQAHGLQSLNEISRPLFDGLHIVKLGRKGFGNRIFDALMRQLIMNSLIQKDVQLDIDLHALLLEGNDYVIRSLPRFDAIMCHSLLGTLACLLPIFTRTKPTLLYLYDWTVGFQLKYYRVSWFIQQFSLFLEKIVVTRFLKVATTSDWLRRYWSAATKREIYWIPLGCYRHEFPSMKKDMALTVTRWSEIRNPEFFVRVADLVRNTDIHLATAGYWNSALLFESIRKQVKDRRLEDKIYLYHKIPEEYLDELMASAKCFLSPPLNKGLAMTALEAGSRGTPIISPSDSEAWELFIPGEDGIMVRSKTHDSYAKALNMLADNRLWNRKAKSIWRRSQQYNWDEVAKKIKELIEDRR